MKIKITSTRYLRSRSWTASFGGWSETAKTKAEAVAALEKTLQHMAEHGHRLHVVRITGTTFILRAQHQGWEYAIVHDDQPDRWGTCSFGVRTWEEAKAVVDRHARSMAEDRAAKSNTRVCVSCGVSFTPSYGEHSRCEPCMAKEHKAAERDLI